MATIATHNGSSLSQGHNRRDERYTSKDGHIDPNGLHEIWFDKDIKEMYHELFDEAVEQFNQEEKKADRKIADYYQKIKADKQKHLAYETIIGVYKTDKKVSEATKKEILKEYCDTWEERNPNLKLLGVYYHADEPGEPHVHIDYIPVATYEKGLRLRNGIKRALEQQGFSGKTRGTNPVKQWTKRENEYLEKLCNDRGIEVEHDIEKKKHLSVREYKEINSYIKEKKKKIDEEIRTSVEKEVEKQTQEKMDEFRKDMPKKKGLLKKYSKKDIQTLEDQVLATKVIENQIKMPIADLPMFLRKEEEKKRQYLQDVGRVEKEAKFWKDQYEKKEEREKNLKGYISDLNRDNERLRDKYGVPQRKKTPMDLECEKQEREKVLSRTHDDFDKER